MNSVSTCQAPLICTRRQASTYTARGIINKAIRECLRSKAARCNELKSEALNRGSIRHNIQSGGCLVGASHGLEPDFRTVKRHEECRLLGCGAV
jgi:hypothetical protein